MDTSTLFQDKADLYAAGRPLYPSELFAFLASIANGKDRAWDCATGNGQAALGLANHFRHVDATDIADNQIANAFQHDRIAYSTGSAEKTRFPDHAFDLVNVAQALHWFDFDTFWPEVRRVLKPNGTFAAYCYAWSCVSPDIDEAVEKYVKDAVSDFWAPNNRHCVTGYATLDFPIQRVPTPTFETVYRWNFARFMDYILTWSAVRRRMDRDGTSFFDLAREKIRARWGDEHTVRDVRTPLHVVAGTMLP